MPKDKALRDVGLTALCEQIRAIRATAAQSGSAVAALAESVDQSLQEIETALNDFPQSVAATIPITGWVLEETADGGTGEVEDTLSSYPYYYDLAVAGVTAVDHATVTIAPASYGVAVTCGLCPTNETLAGVVRLRAVKVPESPISVEYWIESGKIENGKE